VRDVLERWLAPLAVGSVAFAAASVAMLPGLGFWDTAELQTVAPLLGTAHPTGYPTYVILGWVANLLLTPFGEPALRMNLFAGLCLAVAAAVTADLVRVVTRSAALGVAAGIGLALTTVVWRIGLQAEAHALHLGLTAILFRLLIAWEDDRRDRTLILAAIVYGLSVGNHSLSLLLAPAIGLFVFAVEPGILGRRKLISGAALAMVVTVVLVFLELPLRAGIFRAPLVYGHPETWDGFWYVALAEQFRGSLFDPFGNVLGKAAALVGKTVAAFGPLAPVIPIALVATTMLRPRYALLSGTAAAITCFFAASYVNADIDRYYVVPAMIAWTWLAILASGVATLVARNLGESRGPEPVMAVALAAVLLAPTVADVPVRLASIGRSRDVSARVWVEHALGAMHQKAVIISWWSYSTPLWYAQLVEGKRTDIRIIDDRTRLDENLGGVTDVIDANLPIRPVYVIRVDQAEIDALESRYDLEYLDGPTAAGLTRVLGRRAGT
jgi:transmembrane protein TMEM260 (protein O-mannosyltransferase)